MQSDMCTHRVQKRLCVRWSRWPSTDKANFGFGPPDDTSVAAKSSVIICCHHRGVELTCYSDSAFAELFWSLSLLQTHTYAPHHHSASVIRLYFDAATVYESVLCLCLCLWYDAYTTTSRLYNEFFMTSLRDLTTSK